MPLATYAAARANARISSSCSPASFVQCSALRSRNLRSSSLFAWAAYQSHWRAQTACWRAPTRLGHARGRREYDESRNWREEGHLACRSLWSSHAVATYPYLPVRRPRGPGTGGNSPLLLRARPRRGPHQGLRRRHGLVTDTFIRRGRYPDFKGLPPFTQATIFVGIAEQTGRGVTELRQGQVVADLCVIGGYAQYAIRPAHFLVAVPDGVDPAEAVCIPLAYLTAFQMLTRYTSPTAGCHDTRHRRLGHRRHRLARSGASSRPQGDWHLLGCEPGCGRALRCNRDRLSRRRLRRGRAPAHRKPQGWRQGVDAAFDAIMAARISTARSACLAPGGLLVGYGSQNMAVGSEGLGFRSTRPGLGTALGCAEQLVRRPERGVLQHHRPAIGAPGGVQGRHG